MKSPTQRSRPISDEINGIVTNMKANSGATIEALAYRNTEINK